MSKTDNTANQNSRANQNTASNQQSPANQQSSKLHPDVKNYVKLFFKENKLVAFLSMIVFIALSMIYTAISWILQIIFDYMAGKGAFSLATILLLVVSFMLAISLIFALKRSAYPRFLEKAMNQYKESVIKKLLKKSYSDFSLANSGTYLSVLTNDCERIQEKYLKKIFDFVQDVLMLVSSLALMIY